MCKTIVVDGKKYKLILAEEEEFDEHSEKVTAEEVKELAEKINSIPNKIKEKIGSFTFMANVSWEDCYLFVKNVKIKEFKKKDYDTFFQGDLGMLEELFQEESKEYKKYNELVCEIHDFIGDYYSELLEYAKHEGSLPEEIQELM